MKPAPVTHDVAVACPNCGEPVSTEGADYARTMDGREWWFDVPCPCGQVLTVRRVPYAAHPTVAPSHAA